MDLDWSQPCGHGVIYNIKSPTLHRKPILQNPCSCIWHRSACEVLFYYVHSERNALTNGSFITGSPIGKPAGVEAINCGKIKI